MQKDFWRNAKVAVIGGGSWGTVLANLVSLNSRDVRVWVRDEDVELQLSERVHAYSALDRVFEGGVQAVIWVLPSSVCREQARLIAPYLSGEEIILHGTKGIEFGSLKRVSEILHEELLCPRIGVISGPNLAAEVARGEPAATVVGSAFNEVLDAGQELLGSEKFRVYRASDVIGLEWAGTLKNILAIASGCLETLKFGWNARALLITRGLAEMVRFGVAMGAEEETFLGLAGVGDLLATASSPLSRNYQVGAKLAAGEKLSDVLEELGSTAEGVETTRAVFEYARAHGIEMPITEGVYQLLNGNAVGDVIKSLMSRPPEK
jgi:glycerol-3-phosphate dehydrogenase (NAD(P)+)